MHHPMTDTNQPRRRKMRIDPGEQLFEQCFMRFCGTRMLPFVDLGVAGIEGDKMRMHTDALNLSLHQLLAARQPKEGEF